MPAAVEPLISHDGRTWALFEWLPGEPNESDGPDEQRMRGRLLAELHSDTVSLANFGQRNGCHDARQIVHDENLRQALRAYEKLRSDQARLLLAYLDRARELFTGPALDGHEFVVLHGDFAPRNLLYQGTKLTGIIDFEATHLNYRVADFVFSWSGRRHEIIHGYEEVRRLDDIDRALLAPTFWAWAFIGVTRHIQQMVDGNVAPHGLDWQLDRPSRIPLSGAVDVWA